MGTPQLDSAGQRLKHFIKSRFKTQKAFGLAIGMSETQISFYCNDETTPGMDVMSRFQEAGLSLDWYSTGLGTMDFLPVEGLVRVAIDSPIADWLRRTETAMRDALGMVEELRRQLIAPH